MIPKSTGTKPFLDLTGKQFGRLTAQRFISRIGKDTWWECRCECGNLLPIRLNALRTGNTRSCKCLQHEFHRTHGHTRGKHGATNRTSSEYRTWDAMIQRCTNPNDQAWKYYGGRGIKVCRRWRKFVNFLTDMGNKPEGLTIERIDNDKGYNLKNCRWATMAEQAKNKRPRGTA